MALDKGLVQNINLRANGDQLLAPMRAFGREVNKLIADLNKLTSGFSKGAKDNDNKLRAQVQTIQRLIGEASTLQNILTGANGRRRNRLLEGLDAQSMGRKALSASKLKRELDQTKSAADALEVRLAQLYKRFNDLADAGRRVGQRDIAKAMNTEEAIRQVRRLEQEVSKLDARVGGRAGLSTDGARLRADLQRAQDTLLSRVQNGRRVNWTAEIVQVEQLTNKFRQLVKAENDAADAATRAAAATRRSVLQNVNQSEAMLRASLERGASRYRFTPEQARATDMLALGRSIDSNIQRMGRLREMMSNAMAQGRSQAVVDRLARSWETLSQRISESIAMRRAFDNLPETRMQRLNEMLFGGGGTAFATRIGGAAIISTAVFGVINALREGARAVVEFEDALHRLQAIAGATDQEMQKMGQSILTIAQNSRYSTVEITQAATQIAQAGFSAQETAQVLGDALALATASGTSPAEAVDTLTSSLGSFQLQASESTRVVDVLVQGLNRSKLSINQMQAAIQYAGATAYESGIRFEELVAISASLANAGIRSGSTIGTGMRQLLVDLRTPSEDFRHELEALNLTMADVDVRALGMAEVVKRLTDAGFSAEQAYASFEVRAASAFLAFRNQVGVYDELALSIVQTGAAQEAQGRAMSSLTAKWQRLLNNLNALVSGLSGPLMDALSVVVDMTTAVIAVFNELNRVTGGLAAKLAILVAAFAIHPLLSLGTAFAMLIGELRNTTAELDRLTAVTNEAQAEFESQVDTVNAVDQAIQDLIAREETLRGNSVALQTETATLSTRFEGLVDQLGNASEGYDGLRDAMLRYRGEALEQAALTAETTRDAARVELNEVNRLLNEAADGRRLGSRPVFVGDRAEHRQGQAALGSNNADDVQRAINALRRTPDFSDNSNSKAFVEALQERLALLLRARSLYSRITVAERNIGIYQERSNQAGQARDRAVLDAQTGIGRGTRLNQERAGSGDALINNTIAAAERTIRTLQQQLEALGSGGGRSPRGIALQSSISQLQAQIAGVRSTRARETRERGTVRDQPGARLTPEQVFAEIDRRVPRAVMTDGTRTVDEQRSYGTWRGPPEQAPHVRGNALDLAPIRGMDPMEIVAIIEDMGLRVTAGPVRAPGVRYVSPNHGTGPHWHFEFERAQTNVERAAASEAERQARELQQLMEAQAEAGVGEQRSRIGRITQQARNGTRPVGELTTELRTALDEFRAARLNAFDVANPTEGLSDTLLQARTLARQALERQITEETAGIFQQVYRHVADTASNALDAAMAAADRAFTDAEYESARPLRYANSQGARLQNRASRFRYGEGAAYIQERRLEEAQLATDRGNLANLQTRAASEQAAIATFEANLTNLQEGSEAHAEALEQLAEARERYNQTLRETTELQQEVNDRTREFDAVPIKVRLEAATMAWLENSGAMDTWAKRVENSVGPMLDRLVDGLAGMWTSIIDGTKSVGAALKDFLADFAKFVLQMIMRALALEAVKLILSSLGIQVPTSFEGGPVAAPGRYHGGAVGQLYGGGKITRGHSTHDSALYNLAHGEYVVRNRSVREIGLANMEMINRYGSKGLAKIAGAGVLAMGGGRNETNVFVVQEKQRPAMGPNDVLVTIQEDILQGGATKKLIKQVAQGA